MNAVEIEEAISALAEQPFDEEVRVYSKSKNDYFLSVKQRISKFLRDGIINAPPIKKNLLRLKEALNKNDS